MDVQADTVMQDTVRGKAALVTDLIESCQSRKYAASSAGWLREIKTWKAEQKMSVLRYRLQGELMYISVLCLSLATLFSAAGAVSQISISTFRLTLLFFLLIL